MLNHRGSHAQNARWRCSISGGIFRQRGQSRRQRTLGDRTEDAVHLYPGCRLERDHAGFCLIAKDTVHGTAVVAELAELFYPNCRDEAIADFLKEL